MSTMSLSRIKYLSEALDNEDIDLDELNEIESAFRELKKTGVSLMDEVDNAMASDMLNELASAVSPMERKIYDYVAEHYGESEANDPSWDIRALAKYLEEGKS